MRRMSLIEDVLWFQVSGTQWMVPSWPTRTRWPATSRTTYSRVSGHCGVPSHPASRSEAVVWHWFKLIREKVIHQGTHCTGKTGNMTQNIPCHWKHREFGNFAKTQGILFAQVDSLILKVKDIAIFAVKISIFIQKLDRSAKSVLCM